MLQYNEQIHQKVYVSRWICEIKLILIIQLFIEIEHYFKS